MMEPAYILDLPVELLQHIARACDKVDVFRLRLASKDMDAAIFDVFAECFQHQYIFILDPARLTRFQKILSFPRLARKLKYANFCFDPYEYDSTRAFPEHLRIHMFEDPIVHDQYDKYGNPPGYGLLVSIFEGLTRIGCPTVDFDFTIPFCQENGTKLEDNSAAVLSPILRAGLHTSVESLELYNVQFHHEDLINALRQWSQTLEYVSIDAVPPFERDDDLWPDHWREIIRILAACTKLKGLTLDKIQHWCDNECEYTQFLEYTEGHGFLPATLVEILPSKNSRQQVLEFCEVNLKNSMPVCEDKEALCHAHHLRKLKLCEMGLCKGWGCDREPQCAKLTEDSSQTAS